MHIIFCAVLWHTAVAHTPVCTCTRCAIHSLTCIHPACERSLNIKPNNSKMLLLDWPRMTMGTSNNSKNATTHTHTHAQRDAMCKCDNRSKMQRKEKRKDTTMRVCVCICDAERIDVKYSRCNDGRVPQWERRKMKNMFINLCVCASARVCLDKNTKINWTEHIIAHTKNRTRWVSESWYENASDRRGAGTCGVRTDCPSQNENFEHALVLSETLFAHSKTNWVNGCWLGSLFFLFFGFCECIFRLVVVLFGFFLFVLNYYYYYYIVCSLLAHVHIIQLLRSGANYRMCRATTSSFRYVQR